VNPKKGLAGRCDAIAPPGGLIASRPGALGTGVMGAMIAVVILALPMVPLSFLSVQRWPARDRSTVTEPPTVQLWGRSASSLQATGLNN
jgi:hypothetical protein